MFTIAIADAKGIEIMDRADSFDSALTRYADIAWEDPPHRLLGRTVIIREAGTGDVWAVGSYEFSGPSGPPLLTFSVPRHRVVCTFRHDNGLVTSRVHGVEPGILALL